MEEESGPSEGTEMKHACEEGPHREREVLPWGPQSRPTAPPPGRIFCKGGQEGVRTRDVHIERKRRQDGGAGRA